MAKEVTLLTGFLGAGKTTLLNQIITQKTETRFAIVENEIGEMSIDAELVVKGATELVELNNGCLCCSLNDDIFEVLNELWDKREQWDHLIIEATGIADPANIAQPFLTMEQVKRGYILKRVICVVDAEQVEDQLRETAEAVQQLVFSDLILLNKTEKVSPEYLLELQATLKSINPFATVYIGTKDDYKIKQLFQQERILNFSASPQAVTPKGIFSISRDPAKAAPLLAISSLHQQHQHSEIETILLRYTQSMDITLLEHRMMVFLILQSASVYRIKGIIYSEGFESKIILQTVGKSLAVDLGERWLPDELRESKVVFIGKNLQVHGFDKMFRDCLTKNL
ncbi:CobW family GTP-binding protein [Pedobacter duraquae]|uniref:G3E family GTPase n=1 Tax=Pedobacter duraquae TaxID=425511 RepID=A0A4R6IP51_9SPHI|nr:GTP-binding protein [Pedobacter duraquae]TDO23967.1 G3E family GTPase [Pedobacter duraquae]